MVDAVEANACLEDGDQAEDLGFRIQGLVGLGVEIQLIIIGDFQVNGLAHLRAELA